MVSNPDVVQTLHRIADLLEIRGENAFKVRAYRLAAVRVEHLPRAVSEVAGSPEGLRSVDGFGAAIAEKMTELVTTGESSYLQKLETEIPPTLLELLELPGVGPRTAAMLWREAGITSLAALDAAARSGSLDGLPRLGARSVQRIVAVLDARERRGGGAPQRRPRELVAPIAESLTAALAAQPASLRVEVAGSFRRGRGSCGDLDILVATDEALSVLRAFSTLPGVEDVLALGSTKSSVLVAGGFQVDCRAIPEVSFGAALQYFTGSQAHNVRLRGRALRMGMTLNEYGVFRNHDGARLAGQDEEDVYAVLGLPWIPPDRREDPGEVDAAERAAVAVEV